MTNNTRLVASVVAIVTVAFMSHSGASELPNHSKWPLLVGGNNVHECVSAYALAKEAFMSNSPELETPKSITQNVKIIDWTDKTQFEQIDRPYLPAVGDNSFRTLFWGKPLNSGKRVVMRVDPLGWQYESVSAYVLDQSTKPEILIEDIKTSVVGQERFPPFIREKGDVIVAMDSEDRIWIADTGYLHATLSNWDVYTFSSGSVQRTCSIKFLPEHKKTLDLLPKAVSRYVSLLDMTLGDGRHEGSLQQTRRIRIEVEGVIANIAVRPWALPSQYNSTAEVKSGLRAWASRSSWNAQHYKNIQEAYYPALQALRRYYANSLKLADQESMSKARTSMDTLLRAHYVFHREN